MHLAKRTVSASAGISHIFTSNLQRAYRTAEAVRDALASPSSADASSSAGRVIEVVRLPDLREKHFGSGEGQKFGARSSGEAHVGAEDHDSMRVRAERFVDEYLAPIFACVDEEPDGSAESVVVVAHGIILGVLARTIRAAGNFGTLGPSPEDQLQFSWSNTGYVEIHIAPSASLHGTASKDAAPTVKWPNLFLKTVAVNCTDHLHGLKKTRGGIGSTKFDEKQKTLSAFFAPTAKKRKHGDET